MKRFLLVLGGCLFLSACVTSGSGVNALGPSVSEIQAMPVDEAQTHLAGKTVMTFIERHKSCKNPTLTALGYCEWIDGPGTQVEYFAEDGQWYLWSPGSTELASGRWTLRSGSVRGIERHHVCMASSGSVINVLARYPQEDDFRCVLLAEYAGKITEARESDLFQLRLGRMPFPLNDEPTTIDDLLKRGQSVAHPRSQSAEKQ